MSDDFLTFLIKKGNNWFEINTDDNIENIDTKTKPKKNYIKKKDEIMYNIFNDAIEYTNDDFWKSILQSAAKGSFKKGIKYKEGTITYKNKNKIFSKILKLDTPQNACISFIEFMREDCGFFSINDKKNKNEKIEKIIKNNDNKSNINNWNKIKTYIQKNICINEYIERIIKEKKITGEESKNFKNILMLGILSGYFNSKTIEVNDSKIVNIVGLEKNDKGIYTINIKENIPITTKDVQDNSEFTETLETNSNVKTKVCKVNYTKLIIDFFDKLNKN
jgi:hypothetical protein